MPRLLIRAGEGQGRDQALGGECTVGRHPTVDFVIEDRVASRRHFRVLSQAGTWVLEDLGSTNGTFVNGQRVRQVALHDGDVIRVGTTELVFVQKDLLGALGAKAVRPAPPPAAVAPPALPEAPVRRRRRR